jgi:hypothetical protein
MLLITDEGAFNPGAAALEEDPTAVLGLFKPIVDPVDL